MSVPKYHELFNPILRAMRELGGSAAIPELAEEVIRDLQLPEKDIAELHGDRGTELEYRLAWARSYLKAYGLLENSARGVWTLTPAATQVDYVDTESVRRVVRQRSRNDKGAKRGRVALGTISNDQSEAVAIVEQAWRDDLLATLRELSPATFERLCQRLLRESGFVQVRVTGRTGDGGIDGVGIVRVAGLLGFPVLFQCKRYSGTVSSSSIRDFRGAMVGRADRGLLITTGTFSRDARIEATRDGAPLIDLVDGEELLDKLKELGLGVKVELVEQVSIVREWFTQV